MTNHSYSHLLQSEASLVSLTTALCPLSGLTGSSKVSQGELD